MKWALIVVLALQLGPGTPDGPIRIPNGTVTCDGSETPCDPARPWMRGTIEKWCGKTPEQVKAMQEKAPGTTILVCACKHMCNPKDEYAAVTGGVTWDAACETRCNPENCKCPRKCDS